MFQVSIRLKKTFDTLPAALEFIEQQDANTVEHAAVASWSTQLATAIEGANTLADRVEAAPAPKPVGRPKKVDAAPAPAPVSAAPAEAPAPAPAPASPAPTSTDVPATLEGLRSVLTPYAQKGDDQRKEVNAFVKGLGFARLDGIPADDFGRVIKLAQEKFS